MADEAPTTAELLQACQEAIYAILVTGQEYVVFNSRKVTRADLGMLQELEKRLLSRQARESGYTGVNTADFREV